MNKNVLKRMIIAVAQIGLKEYTSSNTWEYIWISKRSGIDILIISVINSQNNLQI